LEAHNNFEEETQNSGEIFNKKIEIKPQNSRYNSSKKKQKYPNSNFTNRNLENLEKPENSNFLENEKFEENLENLETIQKLKLTTQNWLCFGDALELSSGNLPFQNFILFASLPYNVGSRILVEMALNYPDCPFCVIVQKEVAIKILPSSNLTFFGAFLGLFYDFEKVFDISGGSFSPAPKVTSSLLVGVPKLRKNLEKLGNETNSETNSETKLEEKLGKKSQKKEFQKAKKSSTIILENELKSTNLCQNSNQNQTIIPSFENPSLENNRLVENSQKKGDLDSILELQKVLEKTSNRQKICQILKKLFGMPSKTLANNLQSLDWDKIKIDKFVAKNNYQNIRLNWQNYEQILWQVYLVS